MKKSWLVMLWVLASLGCMSRTGGVPWPQGSRLIDLTYSFDERTVYWPTSPSHFELKTLSHGMTEAGFFYASNIGGGSGGPLRIVAVLPAK